MPYQAFVFRSDSDAYRLELTERPNLNSSDIPDECILMRVRAVSLNYRDIVAWRNLAKRNVDGRVPASDGAGEIVACGPKVQGFEVGDRVAGCFFQEWNSGPFDLRYHKSDLGGNLDGMLQQYRCLPAHGIVKIPSHLSYEQAATLPCAAVTAWNALVNRGNIKKGESILCLGTGGVSIFALQFAVALGCQVFLTSSSDEKLKRAISLGAQHGINYRSNKNWSEEIWRLTSEHGVNHIIEVGGPGTLEESLKSIAPEGHIALIGVLTGFGAPTASLFPLMARNAKIEGIYVGSRQHFMQMNAFIEQMQITPIIDKTFELRDSSLAFKHLESGNHFGKVVIKLDD